MLDRAFFDEEFVQMVHDCSRDHEDSNVLVEVVTDTGERLDILRVDAIESGVRVSTRDDRLVFLPYDHIAHIDVSPTTDQRRVGFRLTATSSA